MGTSILLEICAVHESLFGTSRTCPDVRVESVMRSKADHDSLIKHAPDGLDLV